MPREGQRRTRPWAALRGATAEANAIADLLRTWLDERDLSLADVVSGLSPEHFVSGKVPSRSTVAERLAGVGVKPDFVQAIADICSSNEAERERRMEQVRAVREQVLPEGPGQPPAHAGMAADLVVVQKRSLEISDKLLRALERAQELERERHDANHMVLLLLTMVDKLQRDITALTRERDRIRDSVQQQPSLDSVRARLVRSEQQRTTAEAELERARAERHKADRLAEEASEQVRILTEELDRLRGHSEAEGPFDRVPAPAAPPDELYEATAADIDQALAKAARHLDDKSAHLDRLADELHLDNLPDNRLNTEDALDILPGGDVSDQARRLAPADVLDGMRRLHREGVRPKYHNRILVRATRTLTLDEFFEAVDLLRASGLEEEATELVGLAGTLKSPPEVAALIDALRQLDRPADTYKILESVSYGRPSTDVTATVSQLRDNGNGADAYQLLAAVGRQRPVAMIPGLMHRSSPGDNDWILEAAKRDRSFSEIRELVDELRRAGLPGEADQLSDSYLEDGSILRNGERTESGILPMAEQPHHAHLFEDGDDDSDNAGFRTYQIMQHGQTYEWGSGSFGVSPLVRPYAMTGGLSRPRIEMSLESMLVAADGVNPLGLLSEHATIFRLCHSPISVASISQMAGIPEGISRIIVAELVAAKILILISDARD
ncbi:DUF742 domain-containing protein [Streptomyces erythrochromogenes]|uniref:DUF742 domain-containing protein n=1 Tax=Streptomyces erythrochromogenes TaxID=285574 RepID=UPI00362592D0